MLARRASGSAQAGGSSAPPLMPPQISQPAQGSQHPLSDTEPPVQYDPVDYKGVHVIAQIPP